MVRYFFYYTDNAICYGSWTSKYPVFNDWTICWPNRRRGLPPSCVTYLAARECDSLRPMQQQDVPSLQIVRNASSPDLVANDRAYWRAQCPVAAGSIFRMHSSMRRRSPAGIAASATAITRGDAKADWAALTTKVGIKADWLDAGVAYAVDDAQLAGTRTCGLRVSRYSLAVLTSQNDCGFELDLSRGEWTNMTDDALSDEPFDSRITWSTTPSVTKRNT
jgi:hypothetical protein